MLTIRDRSIVHLVSRNRDTVRAVKTALTALLLWKLGDYVGDGVRSLPVTSEIAARVASWLPILDAVISRSRGQSSVLASSIRTGVYLCDSDSLLDLQQDYGDAASASRKSGQ